MLRPTEASSAPSQTPQSSCQRMCRLQLHRPVLAHLCNLASKSRVVPSRVTKCDQPSQQHPRRSLSLTFDIYPSTSQPFSTSSTQFLHNSSSLYSSRLPAKPSFLATFRQRAAKSTSTSSSTQPKTTSPPLEDNDMASSKSLPILQYFFATFAYHMAYLTCRGYTTTPNCSCNLYPLRINVYPAHTKRPLAEHDLFDYYLSHCMS